MGECQSSNTFNCFECRICKESSVEADNFCLAEGCKLCPMCDFCSEGNKHQLNTDIKSFNWLFIQLVNLLNRDMKLYTNEKISDISNKLRLLTEVWKKEPLVSLSKKLDWLNDVRLLIREYFLIPKGPVKPDEKDLQMKLLDENCSDNDDIYFKKLKEKKNEKYKSSKGLSEVKDLSNNIKLKVVRNPSKRGSFLIKKVCKSKLKKDKAKAEE